MKIIRRVLGVLVMVAGILGLVLSVAGLAMVWVAKPTVAATAGTTLDTLNQSVVTSQNVMEITREALGATTDSVDALSVMLRTTATTVDDTQPVLDEFNTVMATTLPSTLEAASDSLYAAQQAAAVLEEAIESLEAFRSLISATPLLGGLLPEPEASYDPEVQLADSLGELAYNLEELPDTFITMSEGLSTTDEQLVDVQANLITMSDSVVVISSSLSEYEAMIVQSQSSMDELRAILSATQDNLPTILNGVAIGLSLFFVWLLAAQVVIFSQGLELYRGTAERMGGEAEGAFGQD